MKRNSLNVFVKYLIGFSLALIAVSNCFNVLSNSSLFVASPSSEVSAAETAKPQYRSITTAPSAADKLNGDTYPLLSTPLNNVNHLAITPPPGLRTAGFASPFATTLTATKTDNRPSVDPANANPGDTIMYTVVITNTGAMDATNVMFTDTINSNTTLVAGSVKIAPIAVNDSYNTIGNVNFSIAAPGVMTNDLNPNGSGTLSVTQVNATAVPPGGMATASTANGSVTMHSDGSFDYSPNAGFAGPTDTFTYTLSNSATPGKTDTATVTITINGMIWFVDDNAVSAGANGTLQHPFPCLAGAGVDCFSTTANDQVGDNIFLYSGNYPDTTTLTLLNTQKLIGQGATQPLLTITGLTAPSGPSSPNPFPMTGGANPVITGTNITAITLGQNNQLHGFTVGNTGATGIDILGATIGNSPGLTVKDVTVNGSGKALDLASGTIVSGSTFATVESTGGSATEGVRLNTVGGSFTITTTNIVDPTGTGIDVQSAPSGTSFSFGATTVNKGSTNGTGVNLNSNIGTFSFSSLAVTTNNGTGVSATSSGTVNVTTGSIAATGGPALLVNPTTLGMTFTSVTSTNSTTSGISLTSVSGSLAITTTSVTNSADIGINVQSLDAAATVNFGTTTVSTTGTGDAGINLASNGGTISFGATSSVTGAGGTAFNVSAGNAGITYAGNITQNNAQRVVNVDGITGGGVSFTTGTVTGGASSTGVNINNANGNVSFNNLTLGTSVSRINNQAVTITNGGNTATYGLGTVSIFTNNVSGIVSTGFDGTLNITTGTVDSGQGTAINIDGPAGLTSLGISLTKVTSSGGTATGLMIQDTNGSFTVNGDGTNTTKGGNATGGTLANKTGADGSTATGCGIFLNNVTNITLRRMQINDHQNSGIRGTSVTGFTLQYSTINGVNGTASGPVEGSIAFGSPNPSGTNGFLGSGLIDNCKISGGVEHNVEFYNQSGTLNALTISNSDIMDNSVALGGDGIQMESDGTASVTVSVQNCIFDDNKSQTIQASALGSSSLNVTIDACTVTRTNQGNEGFNLQNAANGNLTAHITNNNISGIAGTTIFVGQVVNNANNASNLVAVIKDNTVTQPNPVANRAIVAFFSSTAGQTPPANVLIEHNTVTAPTAAEIIFVSTPDPNTSPHFTATVFNNIVTNTDNTGTALRSIAIQSTQTTSVGCFDVRSNTVTYPNETPPGPPPGVAGLRVRQAGSGVANLEQGGSSGTAAAVLAANNPSATTEVVGTVTVVANNFCQNAPTGAAIEAGVDTQSAATTEDATRDGARDAELTRAPDDLVAVLGQKPAESDVAKLSQAELSWMVQAALERWRQAGLSPEDMSRLQAISFEVADLPDGKLAESSLGRVKVDETAAGYGWFFDQTPMEDSEFDLPVPERELQTTDLSPAHGKMDLLTVVTRELGRVYLEGKKRIPAALRPLMEGTLSPAVRRMPAFNVPVRSTSRVISPARLPGDAKVASTTPSATPSQPKSASSAIEPKIDSVFAQPSAGSFTSLVDLKRAVFNPRADLLPGSYERSARRMSHATTATSARTAIASPGAPFSGETIGPLNLGTIPVGEKITLMFSVTVNDPVGPNITQICNQGQVSADGIPSFNTDDPDTGTAGDQTCTPLNVADISVTKTDSPDPVNAGSNITYTVTVTNNGPAVANNVALSDAVPPNTTFVSVVTPAGWTRTDAVPMGGTGTLMFSKSAPGMMANGESAMFTIVVKVNSNVAAGIHIMNSATATTTSPNPTANDTGTSDTTVQTSADLAVTKSDSPDPVTVGGNITYTINFTNNGPSDAQNVTVTDATPANTTFVSAVVTTGSGWGVANPSVGGTGNVVFSKTSVLAGETAVFTVVVNVNANTPHNTTITNNAVAASTTTDPTPANNTGTATTTVIALADLAVTKSDSPDPVFAGNNITYTINFVNNGPATAGSVTVTDATPANTTFVSAAVTTGSGWSTMSPSVGGTGNVEFSKAAVANGETAVFTIVVKVNSNTASGTTITNSVTAATTNSDPDTNNNTATTMTTVNTQADIAVTKSDSPDPVSAGANLTYTINFVNNGPSDAQTVTVTDATPANTTFVSAMVTTGSGWAVMNPAVGGTGNVVFSKATVTAGETAVFTIVVKVNSNTADATVISNDVTAATATTDPTSGNNTANAMTTVQTRADLAVTKSDSPDPVTAGTNLTYTINFANNGPSDAQTVTVTDAVPAGTTFVSAMVTTGTGWTTMAPSVGGTGNVVFSKGTVVAGEVAVFTMVVNVSANTANGTTISNSAVAASATTDPDPSNNTGTAMTTVAASADLAVTKSDSPDPVFAGNNITYTINFTNNGPSDAQSVTVTDATPANTTFVSASVTTGSGWSTMSPAVGGTGNIVFSKSPVAAGETAVFTVVVKVNSNTAGGTIITNNAVAASTTTDPTPANNTGTATTTVQAEADVSITKSDSPDPVFAGNNITYTINFTNIGPSDAQNVSITDAVPANTTFVSAMVTTGSGWGTTAPAPGGTGNVVFNKATVAAGETAVFSIVVKVNANTADGSTINNSATVASTSTDPTSGNNTATADTTVQTSADLAVTKSDSPDPVTAGNNLTYTINFVNNGPSDAQTVTVTDAVPANCTFVSATVTTGTGWGTSTPAVGGTGNVTFSKPTVAAGETAVFTMVVKVNSSAVNGSTITNSATAATATTDPTSGNNTGTATTTVQTQADLGVTKTDSPDPVFAGANLTYTINFVNNGPSDAQTVTVTDAVPANSTFVSASVTTGTGWGIMSPAVGATGNVVFSKATVAAGETAVFTMVVKVNSNTANGTTINNSAVAATTTTDPIPGNNTGTASTTVQLNADLAVTKSDSPDPVIATQNLTYTINFSNNGPSDAQTVTVTDAVPANTTFVSATVTTGTGWSTSAPAVGGTGNVVFSKATVVAGETAVFTIVVNVNGNTPHNTVITNSATAASTTADNNSGNNTGTTTTTVIAQADLAVTKSDSPDPVCVMSNITYTVNFVNNGPGPGLNTTVTDAVPANTTFVSAAVTTGTGWSTMAPAVGGTGNVVFSKASTASGETAVFTIVVKVNNGVVHGTVITNSATAASTIPDPTPGNNTGTTTTTVDPTPPVITCPANITQSTDPNQCSAVVNYTTTASDNCPGVVVVCNPPSGSTFPKGTTTVNCTATDVAGNTATCSFTITVNDTQPPSITCPASVTTVTPDIGGTSAVVTYPNPTATDNCPGVTSSCNPPSGSTFPTGCTTVTCTATDTSSNTATCTFKVCVFNVCLQDDSNANNRILINTQTGDYRFCCNGVTYTGKGKITQQGSTFTLEHNTIDRRVRASVTGSAHSGNATIQSPPGTIRCNLTDSNTSNNTTCGTCQ